MPEQSRSGQEITPAAMTRLGISTSAGRMEAETNKAGSVREKIAGQYVLSSFRIGRNLLLPGGA